MRVGRVLSRRRPSRPASAKRSCQRQTQVFDLAVRRMISFVPSPSAVRKLAHLLIGKRGTAVPDLDHQAHDRIAVRVGYALGGADGNRV
jgi:hypothetical protein